MIKIKSANPEQDKEYRRVAEDIYNRAVKSLKNSSWRTKNIEHLIYDDWNYASFQGRDIIGGLGDVPDIEFKLILVDNQKYGGLYHTSYKKIDIFYKKSDYAKYFTYNTLLKNIRKLFEDKRTTIIHELIHHLDYTRFKGKPKTEDLYENKEKYYNSPVEFNAYYQQLISRFEEEYLQLNKPITYLNMQRLNDISGIKKALLERAGFFNEFDDKYKKKFRKRIALYLRDSIADIKERRLNELNSTKGYNKFWKDGLKNFELAWNSLPTTVKNSNLDRKIEMMSFAYKIWRMNGYLDDKYRKKFEEQIVDKAKEINKQMIDDFDRDPQDSIYHLWGIK